MSRRLIALVSILSAAAYADTLKLKNGDAVTGTFVGGDSRQVQLLVNGEVRTFLISDTNGIHFGGDPDESTSAVNAPPPAPPPPPAAPAPSPAPLNQYGAQAGTNDPPAAPPAQQAGLQIPVGTQIVVRMIDDVDSQRDQVGKHYRASLDNDIVVDGQLAVPRGADVTAKLVNAQDSGKMGGRTVLTLDLNQIRVNGQMLDLDTSSVTHASDSRGKKAGATVGGVAA